MHFSKCGAKVLLFSELTKCFEEKVSKNDCFRFMSTVFLRYTLVYYMRMRKDTWLCLLNISPSARVRSHVAISLL